MKTRKIEKRKAAKLARWFRVRDGLMRDALRSMPCEIEPDRITASDAWQSVLREASK